MSTQEERKAQGKRLREARIAAGYGDATNAAAALGVSRDTYIQHENGTRSFKAAAERYAAKFKTTPEFLLWGRRPEQTKLCAVVGRVGPESGGQVHYSAADRPLAWAPIPPGGDAHMPALLVAGDFMPGYAPDGSLIYLEPQRSAPNAEMLGEVVTVKLETGEVLLKRLLRGSTPELWDLESIAGPTRRDERVVWATFVYCVIPPRVARRILVRLGEAA